ncbi:hypothetical protein FM101_09355 [Arthrobacter rhombi]|uniref:Uncharacterized protein n=1 Tax=Arthrobacter rhombi TaxID=71253 RepID=A0A1R4GC78_9MICC|nr:hypothetical protein FM101_09355 [Arthrobacter rhombi]
MGIALVAGKKRVPNPAAGITALVTRFVSLMIRLYKTDPTSVCNL